MKVTPFNPTPGPWRQGEWVESDHLPVYCNIMARGRRVSAISVYGRREDGSPGGRKLRNGGRSRCVPFPEADSNARLVSAAPDLLDLVELALHDDQMSDQWNARARALLERLETGDPEK